MEQNDKILDVTGAELTPGDPEHCQGNGEHPDFECCCDECDYYLECFPDWEARLKGIEDELQNEPMPWMRVCGFKCLRCGDVLKREYKSPNDYGGGMMTCTCGHLSLDPTPLYWCISGEDVENLCEPGGYVQ